MSSEDSKTNSTFELGDDVGSNRLKKYFNCCSRLHHVLHLIKRRPIEKLELITYLTNTLVLMEDVASDPKFLEADDNEDSVEDVVPAQIKDWLSSTFTTTVQYTRKSERPRFRAVAKAVLAMIMVEKIFKKSNENAALKIPQVVTKMMDNNINNWNFDIFFLNKISEGHGLKNLTMYLFLHHNVLRKYKVSVDCLEAFLEVLESGYEKYGNPFYNSLHAADVLQTVHYFIHNFKLNVWMTDLQTFTILFAALIHGYDNPGVSNSFLIKTNDILALIYNDIHVQENHYVSSVFKLLRKPEYYFLRGMSKEDFSEFRRMTIECVLNMDKTQHFHQMKLIRTELAVSEELDKVKVMSFLLHVSDLSNAAKETEFHLKWMQMMEEQNYKQGDLEYKLNIPYSPLSNRNNCLLTDTMNAFLLYIIDPTFHVLVDLIEMIEAQNTFGKVPIVINAQEKGITKKQSANATGRLYPWESLIVINKSVWQRRKLYKTSASFHVQEEKFN